MLILIDKTNLRMVAAAVKMSHMALIAKHRFGDVSTIVVDSELGRDWTKINFGEMAMLYMNMSGQPAPEYQVAIDQLRAYGATWPVYPDSEEELQKLEPVPEPVTAEPEPVTEPEDEPYVAPIEEPENDGGDHSPISRATHQAIIDGVQKANEAARAAGKPLSAPTEPKADAKPKEKAEPSAPRKPGATKRVWDIADALLASVTGQGLAVDVKAIRKGVVDACVNEGINAGTAATQFGKWKADKGLS
jgi:hypothetical protein